MQEHTEARPDTVKGRQKGWPDERCGEKDGPQRQGPDTNRGGGAQWQQREDREERSEYEAKRSVGGSHRSAIGLQQLVMFGDCPHCRPNRRVHKV
jgi:hypothetical protein